MNQGWGNNGRGNGMFGPIALSLQLRDDGAALPPMEKEMEKKGSIEGKE